MQGCVATFALSLVLLSTAGCGGAFSHTTRVHDAKALNDAIAMSRACNAWWNDEVVALLCDSESLARCTDIAVCANRPGGVKMAGAVRVSGGSGYASQALGMPLTPGQSIELRAKDKATGTLFVHGVGGDERWVGRQAHQQLPRKALSSVDLLLARFDAVKLDPGQRARLRYAGTADSPLFVLDYGGHQRHADAQVRISFEDFGRTRIE